MVEREEGVFAQANMILKVVLDGGHEVRRDRASRMPALDFGVPMVGLPSIHVTLFDNKARHGVQMISRRIKARTERGLDVAAAQASIVSSHRTTWRGLKFAISTDALRESIG
jgi:hypothetical protein